MNRARVAVVTRTKNRAILLERAIHSVLEQKFHDWTHVIVNDGGDAEEVQRTLAPNLEAYRGRIAIINNPASVGMEAASNIGIRTCDSEFVVIHDDDDSWHPDFLQRCVAFMDAGDKPNLGSEYGGVITYSLRILEEMDGESVRTIASDPFNTWLKSVSLFRLASSNVFPPISFLFRRELLDKVGYFREDLPVLGDWDFHLRVCMQYEIGLIPELLAYYHHRESIKSGEYGNTVHAADDKHHVYDALYRNSLLRRDLREGKAGIGYLVNIGRSFEHLHAQLYPFERVLTRLRGVGLIRRLARTFYRGGR
ncbi:MAG: glycosyl transferase family 2 [Gallionellales bacterium RBG_16_56_9]|nr:MAG: glycosyl transferase family 2 [Gallionellales bacterium RBG_16_56_9]